MLGGSLAAQPEHETISVNRMRDHLLSLRYESVDRLYHTDMASIADCQLPIKKALIESPDLSRLRRLNRRSSE